MENGHRNRDFNGISRGFIRIYDGIPSGEQPHSELERSTKFSMGKSTISTGPF